MFTLKELHNIRAALSQTAVKLSDAAEGAALWNKVNAEIERLTPKDAEAPAARGADDPA